MAQRIQYFDGTTKTLHPTGKLCCYPAGTVLTSRTDTQGIITQVNRALSRISGYSKKELLGAPHHIVRHPDFPKTIFKDLWDTIQSGETWHGHIKNLCKNGDHYWVDTTISPIIRRQKIIAYTSSATTVPAHTLHW